MKIIQKDIFFVICDFERKKISEKIFFGKILYAAEQNNFFFFIFREGLFSPLLFIGYFF